MALDIARFFETTPDKIFLSREYENIVQVKQIN